jgi:hypothetical protein
MVKFNTTINIDDQDIEVEVEASVTGGSNGSYIDPPEAPEIEVESITDNDGKTYQWDNLSESEQSAIDAKAMEEAAQESYDDDIVEPEDAEEPEFD